MHARVHQEQGRGHGGGAGRTGCGPCPKWAQLQSKCKDTALNGKNKVESIIRRAGLSVEVAQGHSGD